MSAPDPSNITSPTRKQRNMTRTFVPELNDIDPAPDMTELAEALGLPVETLTEKETEQ